MAMGKIELPSTPKGWVVTGVCVAIVVGGVAVYATSRDRARDALRANANAATERDQRIIGRTSALCSFEKCVQELVWDEEERIEDAAKGAAGSSADPVYVAHLLDPTCAADLTTLLRYPAELPASTIDPLRRLSDSDATFDNTTHDGTKYAAARDARLRVLRDVHSIVLPTIRSQLQLLVDGYEHSHGRDVTWWKFELAVARAEISDAALEASGLWAGKPADLVAGAVAAKAGFDHLAARVATAPIEIQRELRADEYLMQPLAEGKPLELASMVLFVHNEVGLDPVPLTQVAQATH